ncbi:hypothetical protein H6F78_19195 [Coleofasciculus sp. FACHB-64]|uniref:hypothetical protein n=1 Tax=Cyanophyceae TaxID=3028117 RepID=UPI0016880C1E|nr:MULTISPECIES: hypothetical protein [unclassified Coleofasciculus]MBD1841785.1 hypothetical protein [Coleofasciculus sp. FACHB-501]MBD1893404.1 hypothetical protein [Coleofasciculus sp. FACHB-129]MBD1902644.1 hypothetical protein [Coleofasciculus sp. FACHB-125]MBD2047688.1 hypothetical protein [Coleofasciculus sp. FACHB-64]
MGDFSTPSLTFVQYADGISDQLISLITTPLTRNNLHASDRVSGSGKLNMSS